MNQTTIDDDPYSSYKKICTKLLEDYGKCILEKTAEYSGSKAEGIRENSRLTLEQVLDRSSSEFSQNTHACNDQLYLIQKWCMNPVGVVGYNINTNS